MFRLPFARAGGDDSEEDDESDTASSVSWQTMSDHPDAPQAAASESAPYYQPPANGDSPLQRTPDEIILRILQALALPLTAQPFAGCLDSIIAISSVNSCFRMLSYPFLFQSVVLRVPKRMTIRDSPGAIKDKLNHVEFLLQDEAAQHIQSVWIDVPKHAQAANLLEAIDALIVRVAPRLVSLSLENWPATRAGLLAIMNGSQLRNLRMDDGFAGDAALAQDMPDEYAGLQRMREVYCSIDVFPHASAVPFKIIRRLPYAEQVVIRGYRERFSAGFFQASLWSSLRVLALDAGGMNRPGFPALFQEFQEYRQHNLCPLEEVVLESRSPEPEEFEQVVAALKGHTRLKKLSLMLVPRHDPEFLAFVGATLPHLQELNVVAHASAFLVWIGPIESYAQALATFPNLTSFGWNGLPSQAPVRHLSSTLILASMSHAYRKVFDPCKKVKQFIIWKEFGSTFYYGSAYDLPARDAEGKLVVEGNDLGDLLQRPGRQVSFFPLTQGTNIV